MYKEKLKHRSCLLEDQTNQLPMNPIHFLPFPTQRSPAQPQPTPAKRPGELQAHRHPHSIKPLRQTLPSQPQTALARQTGELCT